MEEGWAGDADKVLGDAIRARSKFRQFLDERKDMLEEKDEDEESENGNDAEKEKK